MIKHGGKREGAGRPRGSMNESSKYRMHVKKDYQDRVAKNAQQLFDAQFNLAKGEQYLFCKREVGSGAKKRTVTEIVTDPEAVKQFLDGELNESNSEEYYYLSTKTANAMAIDSMLDRAFGKAEGKLDLTNDGGSFGGIDSEQAEQLIRARARRTDTEGDS